MGNWERRGTLRNASKEENSSRSLTISFATCTRVLLSLVSQVQGHSSLGAWPGLSASNWGGAPYYSNLGARTSYAIPNQTGNGGAYP
jgi:hypothetical protein